MTNNFHHQGCPSCGVVVDFFSVGYVRKSIMGEVMDWHGKCPVCETEFTYNEGTVEVIDE
jgi:hypothetical protein